MIWVESLPTYHELSGFAARHVIKLIESKQDVTLGLATGSTPVGLYAALIQEHRRRKLDLSRITSFNLDEYVGIPPDHPQSYHVFMHRHLFRHVDLPPESTHFPGGDLSGDEYENLIRKSGGIDLQILGIGSNGHIGFNEPGSSFSSRTREVQLADRTIADNARFFDHIDQVPRTAITMGIATILEADHIVLLANGENKADAIAAAVEASPTEDVPASALQLHPRVTVILDHAAASKLKHK